jgi:hypothetical protein
MAISRRATAKVSNTASSPVKKRSKYVVTEGSRADHREKPMKMMTIRLPADIDARVDRAIGKRVARTSKNSWLIEAADMQAKAEGC